MCDFFHFRSGDLDDFDEQSLYQLGDFSWKEFESEEKMPSSKPGEDLGWGRLAQSSSSS